MVTDLKTKPSDRDVQAFIESVEHAGRREDAHVLLDVFARATDGQTPTLWGDSMIGFGTYDYRYESGRSGTWFRTGFSPRKAKMVVYVMPGYTNFDPILARIGPYKKGKSCLYLGRLTSVNLDVLEELIRAGLDDMARRYPL